MTEGGLIEVFERVKQYTVLHGVDCKSLVGGILMKIAGKTNVQPCHITNTYLNCSGQEPEERALRKRHDLGSWCVGGRETGNREPLMRHRKGALILIL